MAKRRNFTDQFKAKVALEALRGDKTVQEIAAKHVKNWMTFYNTERPHSALDRLTPDDAYWAGLEEQKAA